METSEKDTSVSCGEHVPAGTYECTSCGHLLIMQEAGNLPTCPEDEGHHASYVWKPLESTDDADPSLPNSPAKPR